MCLSKDAQAALDRMDEMATIWQAIGDLMIPEGDLGAVNRDNLSCAIDIVRRDYDAARNAFSRALEQQHSPAREAGEGPPDRQHRCPTARAQSGAMSPDGGYRSE